MICPVLMCAEGPGLEPRPFCFLGGDLSLRLRKCSANSPCKGILGFHSPTGTFALLALYDDRPDANPKIALIAGLQENPTITNEWRATQVTTTFPTNALPKSIQIARESPGGNCVGPPFRSWRRCRGEKTTAELVAIYDTCGDNEFKQTLVQYLGGRPDPTAAHRLVTVAQSDPDPRTRQLAVDLIGRMPFGNNRAPGSPFGMPPSAVPFRPAPPGFAPPAALR